jgi:hypothetical protein
MAFYSSFPGVALRFTPGYAALSASGAEKITSDSSCLGQNNEFHFRLHPWIGKQRT